MIRASKATANEKREGIVYQSDIGFSSVMNDEDLLNQPLKHIDSCNSSIKNYKIVYFDIETIR